MKRALAIVLLALACDRPVKLPEIPQVSASDLAKAQQAVQLGKCVLGVERKYGDPRQLPADEFRLMLIDLLGCYPLPPSSVSADAGAEVPS